MKKSLLFSLSILIFLSFTACLSVNQENGDELVEYKKISYESKKLSSLTKEQLRQDCDWLKYYLYNAYAGIDEAIANGLDLDATIEQIYEESCKKEFLGQISTSDFSSVTRSILSKKLKNSDQHIGINGTLKDSSRLYYTSVYFEKRDDGYFVKKSEEESVKEGMKYNGPETNLYKILTDDGILYRYGVMTNKNIKSAVLYVNALQITVNAEVDKPIPSKYTWTGLQSTAETVYVSLGDCNQLFGIDDDANRGDYYWDDYLSKVQNAAAGKKNLIFDLRSNPGGYPQYPARILRAALYNQLQNEEQATEIENFMMNKTYENCVGIISPVTGQLEKEAYKNYFKNRFLSFKPEVQEFLKKYWRQMEVYPLRTHLPLDVYATNLTQLPQPDFKGDIYILLNEYSASASEYATLMAYEFQNSDIKVHIIGENSCGAFKYAGMWSHLLPNSDIYLSFGVNFGEPPLMLSIPNWKGEGNGFYPDYWATNDTILNTLINLTADQELQTVLSDLGKKLL